MNDWAAEWAAFNVGVENARRQYDQLNVGTKVFYVSVKVWPLETVQAIHADAFSRARSARVSLAARVRAGGRIGIAATKAAGPPSHGVDAPRATPNPVSTRLRAGLL